MQNNIILSFLQEFIQRLFTKSPLFFKVWTFISAALVLVTGLPAFINWIGLFNFHIPDMWNAKVTEAVAWSSRAMLLMSALTTQSKAIGKDENGNLLKQTNADKLPFTAQAEEKAAIKDNIIQVNEK